MVVVGLNPRVPKTTCLLPSLSTETQEKASPGGPPAEASLGYLKCPHWGTAGCGSCQGLHHSPMHMLHKEFLGRYAKARRVSCQWWVFVLCFSFFCTLKERTHANNCACSLMALRAIHELHQSVNFKTRLHPTPLMVCKYCSRSCGVRKQLRLFACPLLQKLHCFAPFFLIIQNWNKNINVIYFWQHFSCVMF